MKTESQYKTISKDNYLRLGGSHHAFLENLDQLGPIYIQARNRGGGLGKYAEVCQLIILPEMTNAVDPDLGLAISLDQFIGAHATYGAIDPDPSPSLDLEFSGFPAGLSLIEISELSRAGTIMSYVDVFGGMSILPDELDSWRNEIAPLDEVCDECCKAATHRANNVQLHPIFRILYHALEEDTVMNIRLMGDHVDLVVSMSPEEVYPFMGYIIASSGDGSSVLQMNVEMVHGFQLDTQMIDGSAHSCIRVYDMYGTQNFEISAEGAEHLSQWQELCEHPNSSYHAI